ncbi:hypothetical protein WMY93_014387 [Mugilogobius chulae]|uniref:Uncharacterized protein n=1 Tax=Mugilogobius chulae TaxID=88201 RepID=A0AAW0P4A1_9GOBI
MGKGAFGSSHPRVPIWSTELRMRRRENLLKSLESLTVHSPGGGRGYGGIRGAEDVRFGAPNAQAGVALESTFFFLRYPLSHPAKQHPTSPLHHPSSLPPSSKRHLM